MFFMKMFLTLVIENTTQILFPISQLLGFVKPVFGKCGKNIEFDNGPHPFISATQNLSSAEIAVTDLETSSQRFVLQYFPVQLLDLVDEGIESFVGKCLLVLYESFW